MISEVFHLELLSIRGRVYGPKGLEKRKRTRGPVDANSCVRQGPLQGSWGREFSQDKPRVMEYWSIGVLE